MKNVLIIDDNAMLLEALVRLLDSPERPTLGVQTSEAALNNIDGKEIVVCDFDLGPGQPTGLELLAEMQAVNPDAKYIMFSGLDREVPDGVLFLRKDNLFALIREVKGSYDAPY